MKFSKNSTISILLNLIALAGVGVSAWLTQHFYEVRSGTAGFQSFCNIGEKINCDGVAASSYAELVSGIPISSFSAGLFLALFLISLGVYNSIWKRECLRVLLVLSSIGTLLSLSYLFIMIFQLKTYCLVCLGVDVLSITFLGLTLSLHPGNPFKNIDQKKLIHLGLLTFCSVVVSIMSLKSLSVSLLSQEVVDNLVNSVLSQPPTSVPLSQTAPSFGPRRAPITIVEYSDFQCPYCRIAAFTLHSVVNRYPEAIRVEFRNFPLDQACNPEMQFTPHPVACEAARVALCAQREGKFVEAYKILFQEQSSLLPGRTLELLKATDIPANQIQSCLDSPETSAALIHDIEEAKRLGVKSTPTFFINGHKLEGALPAAVWYKIIDHFLKK